MKPPVKQVIFVSGLSRSGTSALHFMLGSHLNFVPVGEVYGVVDPGSARLRGGRPIYCLCGEPVDRCPFWGPLVSKLMADESSSLSERYGFFLERFAAYFGDYSVPVDSSKNLDAVYALASLVDDLKVVYSIRDVRSWVVSVQTNQRKSAKRSSMRLFWRWYKQNRRKQHHLATSGISWMRMGYEELSLFPKLAIGRMSEFLGSDLEDSLHSFKGGISHSVLVNRMRNDEDKMQAMQYDNRWFWQTRYWQVPSLIFPNIMRYNSQEVYTNVTTPYNRVR